MLFGVESPTNLTIAINGNDVLLDWNEVSNIDHYNVYASDNPETGFDVIDTTVNTNWQTTLSSDKKFYKVTSVKDYSQVVEQGITLQWLADGDYLHVIISAPTAGWVAVGFDPTFQMMGADIMIGYVVGEDVFTRDDYGTSAHGHASDIALGGTNDIMNPVGTESAGNTTISYTIPLNSGDVYDNILTPGNTYTVILAYGAADNYTGYHTLRTSVNIEI